jgi:spermidine/putrescine transport system ATP-binding protein
VRDVSFSVRPGEFVSLLGPSGSGKTTILRLIAGLETASRGEIWLNGERIDERPPFERDVTTVFQDYALFPHMNVFDNVAFGLRCRRRFSEGQIATQVQDALGLVRLKGYDQRTTRHLSGGERQRVALARAVVTQPSLLLLDEPLGALDLQLRRQTGAELTELNRRLGLAFLYVTHDQEEALSMSDRVILMHDGLTEQSGTPEELFWRPGTRFAAQFIGEANVLSGSNLLPQGQFFRIDLGGELVCIVDTPEQMAVPPGGNVEVALRGERILLGPAAATCMNRYSGTVRDKRFYGSLIELTIELTNGMRLRARIKAGSVEQRYAAGEQIELGWQAGDTVLLKG